MAQKNYEKLLTELMKKIPQNRLVKHLFLNYLSSTYKCNFLGADNKQ